MIIVGSIMVAMGLSTLIWLIYDWRSERKRAKLYEQRFKYIRKPRSARWKSGSTS